MSRRDELEQIITQASQELHELRKVEIAGALQRVVGKYFKVHNSYSGGSGYWWKYLAPQRLERLHMVGMSFQQDVDGTIRIDPIEVMSQFGDDGRWPIGLIEIPAEEFWHAFMRLYHDM